MHQRSIRAQLALTAAIATQAGFAGTDTWFTPLTESASVVAPNSLEELSSPWVTPEGISQKNIVSLREVEDTILSPEQSIIRVNAGRSSSMFDMMAYDPRGEYLFIPHETPFGAGCSRYSIYENKSEVILAGDASGDWNTDFAAFDPARYTPNDTVILGEEWSGTGRLVEILNPFAPVGEIQSRVLESIANVSHEGINFSKKFNDTIYYVDEWNSGSIYKFVMTTPGDYTQGQTFVLSVDDFIPSGGVASDLWNEQAEGVVREGMASWLPLTDKNGVPLPGITNPFRDGPTNDPRTNSDTRGGRPAADDAQGTPFGRPEDIAVGRLKNGNEVVYFCATSEKKVYSIEILKRDQGNASDRGMKSNKRASKAIVRTFASADMAKNLGHAPTTGELNSPDNLAIDGLGNIYVIEDAPNSSSTGGDIWFVRDMDNDGVGESLDHFMSIRVSGSEATGMIFNPAIPTEFAVAVQHPSSTDLSRVPDGLGDAVWLFNVTNIGNQGFVEKLNRSKAPFGE